MDLKKLAEPLIISIMWAISSLAIGVIIGSTLVLIETGRLVGNNIAISAVNSVMVLF